MFALSCNGYAGAQGTAAQTPAVPRPLRHEAGHKKLIAFPRPQPDTAFLRQHIAQMEKTPFDGTVFSVKIEAPGLPPDRALFHLHNWSRRVFTEAEFKDALEDLKATKFTRFTHNFLRFTALSQNLDWFDDYSSVINNARVAAGFARQANEVTGGKVPGIKFDPEQYADKIFTYPHQRDKDTKSFDVYAAQVRQRGREVMEAFQAGYPDLTVFMSIGYSGTWYYTQGTKTLPEVDYGLLAAFMDGMTEAARGKTKIVDGFESSYAYNVLTRYKDFNVGGLRGIFEYGYHGMDVKSLKFIQVDPQKYRQTTSIGFGLWLDKNYGDWNTEDVSKNFYTPEAFEATLRKALEVSDEYVWIYTDLKPQWWTEEGKPQNIHPAYFEAMKQVRKGLTAE